MRIALLSVAGVGMLSVALWGLANQPNAQENPQGIEVQARGPIHEAYAQPAIQKQEPSAPVAKKPPEPIDEMPPDEKPAGEDVQWISGYWAWDDDRENYLWVSGVWRVPPPDCRWAPGYWMEGEGGWQWVSGFWSPASAVSVELYSPPPEMVEEAIAPPPNPDSVYVPGIWVYRETRFWWRPGHWIGLRPGWVWAPACYYWTPAGYFFFPGGWDRDLVHRGMCFAPIYVDARWRDRRDWHYRPSYIVRVDFLVGALFVNAARHQYVFGDYYDAAYVRRGYVPWIDYRIQRTAYDPLFAYYRWETRNTPEWDTNLRAVYAARRDNKAPRPPRTFAEQENAPADKRILAVASMATLKTAGVKLAPVSKAQAAELHKHAAEWQRISKTRSAAEIAVKKSNAKQPVERAPVKVELPKTTVITHPAPAKTPPPHPEAPKFQETPKKILKDGIKEKPKDLPFKDKLPKEDPFKDKNPKLPKEDPFKDKGPKDKLPKEDPFKDKGPKDKLPKEPPPIKDKSPTDGSPKDKGKEKDKAKDKDKDKKDKEFSSSRWRDAPVIACVFAAYRKSVAGASG